MAIITIDNYQVNARKPIDTRMVASSSVDREAISSVGYVYEGLECLELDTSQLWIYIGGTWSIEDEGSIIGTGSPYYAVRQSASASLENSNIYISSDLSKVGINTNSPQ